MPRGCRAQQLDLTCDRLETASAGSNFQNILLSCRGGGVCLAAIRGAATVLLACVKTAWSLRDGCGERLSSTSVDPCTRGRATSGSSPVMRSSVLASVL